MVEWVVAKDPEGMTFWTNAVTGDCTWEDPVVFEIVPGVGALPAPPAPSASVSSMEVLDVVRVAMSKLEHITEADERPDSEEAAAILESQGRQVPPSGGVSRTLDNNEVRRQMDRWIQPIRDEVHSLENLEAIYRKSATEARKFLMSHPHARIYPAKGVFVIKGNQKYKARGVICGNFVDKADAEDTYTEAVDATAVRMVLRLGALEDMKVSGTDVSTAFLNAELSESDRVRGILCRAPTLFVEAGVCEKGEVWVINKALYGLRQSPRCWGITRDKFLKGLCTPGGEYGPITLKQTVSDSCVWLIHSEKKLMLGWIVTYVDDILAVAVGETGNHVLRAIKAQWKCSDLEELSVAHPEMSFLGMTLRLIPGKGFFVH
jgi:hypothetical protein